MMKMAEWMKGTVKTILLLPSNWIREWISATFSVCGWPCSRCCSSVMTFSNGIDAKNAPDTKDDSPPNINIIPLTMARIVMIVMPYGLFID
jgi:hypothetical protein